MLFCFYCHFLIAQSSKDISKYKVKAVTNTITKLVEGKEVTFKDSYERYDKNGNMLEEIKYDEKAEQKRKKLSHTIKIMM